MLGILLSMDDTNMEYEIRFLDINIVYVKKRLEDLGYKLKAKRFLQKRYVYDVNRKEKSWLRLLEGPGGSTLAYKRVLNAEIDGTEEIEIDVSDFDTTKKLLEKAGNKPKGYQENYRTLYVKDGVEATIDEWPKIPPYLEIEGKSKEKVEEAVKILNLKYKYTTMNNLEIYKDNGIDLHSTTKLIF